jgi:hypothetical protein
MEDEQEAERGKLTETAVVVAYECADLVRLGWLAPLHTHSMAMASQRGSIALVFVRSLLVCSVRACVHGQATELGRFQFQRSTIYI